MEDTKFPLVNAKVFTYCEIYEVAYRKQGLSEEKNPSKFMKCTWTQIIGG